MGSDGPRTKRSEWSYPSWSHLVPASDGFGWSADETLRMEMHHKQDAVRSSGPKQIGED